MWDTNWDVIVPLDHDASCFLGKGTDWCVAKQNENYFSDYFFTENITLIFVINKQTNKKWAISFNEDEIEYFTQDDKKINSNYFKNQTKLDPKLIIRAARIKNNYNNTHREENKNKDLSYLFNACLHS